LELVEVGEKPTKKSTKKSINSTASSRRRLKSWRARGIEEKEIKTAEILDEIKKRI